MISFALLVPIVAAGSLTAAFLMPIRDERRGERATLRGLAPLRPLFAPHVTTGRQPPGGAEIATSNEADSRALFVERTRSTLRRWFQAPRAPVAEMRVEAQPADIDAAVMTTFEEHVTALLPLDAGPADEPRETLSDSPEMTVESVDVVVFDSHDVPEAPKSQARAFSGRVAVPPLTRTRLRPVRPGITWPARLRVAHVGLSDGDRRELLLALGRNADADDEDALRTAVVEEDGAGRLLALRALAHVGTEPVRRLFRETAIRGSEDERSFAVDVLARDGEREALIGVLADRIDAIAARAALAIVGSHRRVDYESQLAGHIDAARLDELLALLAAVVQ